MPADTELSKARRALTMAAGVALVGTAFLLDRVLADPGPPFWLNAALVLAGCVFIAGGARSPGRRAGAAFANAALVVLSVLFAIGSSELAFRAIRFDFNAPNPAIPIFNRPPDYHMGGGILRRPGPATWRGKPLSSFIRYFWGNENAIPDEAEIEVRYDRHGFRNPDNLDDWEITVVGDSFVESGYLAREKMFTSVAAEKLGARIKNLGVSGTGPVFQTAYLKHFGRAPSTSHAVLCFFDGNDVSDLFREIKGTNYIARTGHRPGGGKQNSLLNMVQSRLNQPGARDSTPQRDKLVPDAVLAAGGREFPAAIWPLPPPRWEDLKSDRRQLVANAVAEWGHTARALGMDPWLMCIPDGRRVMHDHLRYHNTNSPISRWQATGFGPPLAEICATNRVRFIDTFPALRRELEAGHVPYNLFGDVHLSAHGSRVVGELLATELARGRPAN
jgi:hypothetical protein